MSKTQQQPTFESAVIDAYNAMNTQESANDFFVSTFREGTNEMQLVETGKGGMARVCAILEESFASGIAVAMFRVTAVDDRGNNVSLRTKLVHVVYVGAGTPVIKRAKVTTMNAAFKKPFVIQFAVQTDDVKDLNETSIIKALNAGTGAHAPTSYDFENNTVAGVANRNDMAAIKAAQLAEAAAEAEAAAANASFQQEEEVQQEQEEEVQEEVQQQEEVQEEVQQQEEVQEEFQEQQQQEEEVQEQQQEEVVSEEAPSEEVAVAQ